MEFLLIIGVYFCYHQCAI